MATNNGNGTCTVVSGDTLSEIAAAYLSSYGSPLGYTTWSTYMYYLADINNLVITSAGYCYIYPGQKLYLTSSAGTVSSSTTSSATKPEIIIFELTADGGGREVFAQWDWEKSKTDHYEYQWFWAYYNSSGTKIWDKSSGTTEIKANAYTAPDLAEWVTFNVRPIAETTTDSNGNESAPWYAGWSTQVQYYFSENPPTDTPSAPTVTIEDYTLTAELDNIPDGVTYVEFELVADENTSVSSTKTAKTYTNYASYTWSISSGYTYKVRCRYVNDYGTSEWSDWSDKNETKPNAPSGITTCRAASLTSVFLEWSEVDNATSYDLEYTTDKSYFDGSDSTTTVSSISYTSYTKTGLESGDEYFFRVRAVNSQGASDWSDIVSVVLGTEPAAPTTWSSTTTAVTGESLTLYWVHNSEDGSLQDSAEIEIIVEVGGVTDATVITVDTSDEAEDDERTMHYSLSTSGYDEGATILWRVRTAGITGAYGDWSVQRTVMIYAPPTLYISVTDSSATAITSLLSFPFYVTGSAGPSTQTPVGYHLIITSNSYYETIDSVGNRKIVNAGDEVYSKYIDSSSASLVVQLSASNIDLENNITYTVYCELSMDSGLTGSDSTEFTVAWTDEEYPPNAEVTIDKTTLTASINPYCLDENEELVEGVTLSVYRREFDGTFTEIITGLKNTMATTITDPHPALDYARYRIVAITESTGAVSYHDLPGISVKEVAVIIQWDEVWTSYEQSEPTMEEDPSWSGSMLKIPYNIDVSDDHKPDASLIEYIGRSYPVSYYGTQLGHTSSWSVEIPKYDKETLYAIRRLSIWRGNVYVREPSGTGYWANITISYSQKHLDTIIPVKFSITRVEGGV